VVDEFAFRADQRGDATVTRLDQTCTLENGDLNEVEWVWHECRHGWRN
jgi:hypothetical protein